MEEKQQRYQELVNTLAAQQEDILELDYWKVIFPELTDSEQEKLIQVFEQEKRELGNINDK